MRPVAAAPRHGRVPAHDQTPPALNTGPHAHARTEAALAEDAVDDVARGDRHQVAVQAVGIVLGHVAVVQGVHGQGFAAAPATCPAAPRPPPRSLRHAHSVRAREHRGSGSART